MLQCHRAPPINTLAKYGEKLSAPAGATPAYSVHQPRCSGSASSTALTLLRRNILLWQDNRMKSLLIGLVLSLCGVCPVLAAEATTISDANHTTELWEGKALTAHFRVGMCHDKKGKAWGVLELRHATGQEDIYHLYGTLRNNEFNLHHSSGHFLSGRLGDDGTMKGKAKLKNGLRMSLSGSRRLNVPLAAEDCAPLARH